MSNPIFQQVFLSNTVQTWLTVIGVILFMILFSKGISKLVAWFSVRYLTKVDHTNFRESINYRLARPLSRFLFWLVTILALETLRFPEVLNVMVFKSPLSQIVGKIGLAVLIFLFFNVLIGVVYMTANVFKSAATRRGDRSMIQLASLLSDLIKALLIVLCILVIFKIIFNVTATTFATSVGLVTAAIALAAKDTVENIICSIIILLDKPFLIGDYITVNGTSGNVERIGLRRTVLRTDTKTLASVPNRDLTGNKMENVSNQTFRRFRQELNLTAESTAEQLQGLVDAIKMIIQDQGDIITASTVFFKTTGNQGHVVFMEYFVGIAMSYADFCTLNQKINLEVVAAMQKSGIRQSTLVNDLQK